MRELLLIKHAMPQIDPARPAAEWLLSDAGRRGAAALAERLRAYQIAQVVASREPKATATGQILAAALGAPCATAADLHEHDRHAVGVLSDAEFRAAVARFFAQPGQLVFGSETADAARARFAQAVERVLVEHPSGNLAIVAHGTVISLLAAQWLRLDAHQLWQRLGLPSALVLRLPDRALLECIEEV